MPQNAQLIKGCNFETIEELEKLDVSEWQPAERIEFLNSLKPEIVNDEKCLEFLVKNFHVVELYNGHITLPKKLSKKIRNWLIPNFFKKKQEAYKLERLIEPYKELDFEKIQAFEKTLQPECVENLTKLVINYVYKKNKEWFVDMVEEFTNGFESLVNTDLNVCSYWYGDINEFKLKFKNYEFDKAKSRVCYNVIKYHYTEDFRARFEAWLSSEF